MHILINVLANISKASAELSIRLSQMVARWNSGEMTLLKTPSHDVQVQVVGGLGNSRRHLLMAPLKK